MSIIKYCFALSWLVLFALPPLFAQGSYGNDEEGRSALLAGINILSDNVYLGRKDSNAIPYLAPYIAYEYKSGLYAKVLMAYTTQPKSHIDLFTLTAGYEHSFGEHLETGLQLDKYFYQKTATSIRTDIKASAGVYTQYTNDWLQPTVSFDLNFTKSTDFVLGLCLDHEFSFKDDEFSIIPSITMYSGTRNYYNEYINDKLNKTGKFSKLVSSADDFEALVYEFSCEASYTPGEHWAFLLKPIYALPLNPSSLTIAGTTFNEKLNNSFFVEIDVGYRF